MMYNSKQKCTKMNKYVRFCFEFIWLYTKSGAWKNSSPGFQFLYTKRQISNIIKV